MRPMDAACEPYRASARAAKSERLRAGAAQAQASRALGVASARISEMERGRLVDAPLLQRYRSWLESLSAGERRESPE